MELDETTMGVIGILAGILILSGWVPQIVKGYRTKKLTDVSSYLMVLIFAGAVIGALTIMGVPPTSGFMGEWMLFYGVLETALEEGNDVRS